jgi:L-2-hydroxyglutarate oxidase LhgO
MTERVDCVVIGAGVVGLAVARALALRGREVLVVEAEDRIGCHTSSRNSEVIHAGLYYPAGSLKAQLCVAGREALYAYCASRGIGHRRIGKLVVATAPGEVEAVRGYVASAKANGVHDLAWLTAAQVHALEPELRAVAGFLSPSTGIVDSHALMLALQGEAQDHGAALALRAPVRGGRIDDAGIELDVGGAAPVSLRCRLLVNAAGLWAPARARALDGFPARHVPQAHYAKAHYLTLRGRAPFSRLVYPVANDAFLGVHVTLDLAGQVRFGPDVTWVDGVDYRFDEARAPLFYAAVRRYWPGLPDGALQPGYTAVRPKITGPGERAADFRIDGPAVHGVAGLVNLFGIESPGLTACLAIAERVALLLDEAPPRNDAGPRALQASS